MIVNASGEDGQLERQRDRVTGDLVGGHKLFAVYRTMLTQISLDYGTLPDQRSLKLHEIRFFYDCIRSSIKSTRKLLTKKK